MRFRKTIALRHVNAFSCVDGSPDQCPFANWTLAQKPILHAAENEIIPGLAQPWSSEA
tara:strand:+ start:130538 stop:130711 length:174 start_codon:yes stop_codon:yes gene_type:complete